MDERERGLPEGIKSVGSPDVCAQHVQRVIFAAVLEEIGGGKGLRYWLSLYTENKWAEGLLKAQSWKGLQRPPPPGASVCYPGLPGGWCEHPGWCAQ